MELIYSQVEPGVLLHANFHLDDFKDGRIDVSPVEQFLQMAALKLERHRTFKPHKHIKQVRTTDIAQEAWVVIRGKVAVEYYDLDDEPIKAVELSAGSCTLTFRGGHNYTSLSEDTRVYEFKTGPYQGQIKDKIFLPEHEL